MRRLLSGLALLVMLLRPGPVRALGADYRVPASFVLPWACGQSYRVTWEPSAHWESGKATGVAFDFGLPEGTPIYAPFSGTAAFYSDLRPLETTYGQYIDLIDETGLWLVRLAHLRDPQEGARFVRTGDLLGYSGASGVTDAHLHLELLVREGSSWVTPDLAALPTLYGVSRQQLTAGAYVGRDGCLVPVALSRPLEVAQQAYKLGEPVTLTVPLVNRGADLFHLGLVQVSLFSLDGDTLVAEAEGDWPLAAGDSVSIVVSALPRSSGAWYIGRVSWDSDHGAAGVPARGQFWVEQPALSLTGLAGPAVPPRVGERPVLAIGVQNSSDESVTVQGLMVEGARPDGARWQALLERVLEIPAGGVELADVPLTAAVEQVGRWTIDSASYLSDAGSMLFARVMGDMLVQGPRLQVSTFDLYSSGSLAFVLMQITNVGTEPAVVSALELRGWKPDGESFEARLTSVAPLGAGKSALVQLQVPLETVEGTWRFVEAGYWLDGRYYAMTLPGQPALSLSLPVPDRHAPSEPLSLTDPLRTAR